MKNAVIGLVLLACVSCKKDTPGPCETGQDHSQRLTSRSFSGVSNQFLVLDYVDGNGSNVFANSTYDPNTVTLQYNGEMIGDVVDQDNAMTKNMIILRAYTEGKNDFYISLRPTDSHMDAITAYYTIADFSACTGPAFAIDSVFLNDVRQSVKKLSEEYQKLTIIK